MKTKSTITSRFRGISDMSVPASEMQDLQTPGGGATAESPPNSQEPNRIQNMCQCQPQPQPIRVVTSPPYLSQDATEELIGRVSKADIFIGDIWVTALIDTRAQVSTIT